MSEMSNHLAISIRRIQIILFLKDHTAKITAFVYMLFFCCISQAQTKNIDTLFEGFITPPHSAKPITWWHWTGGNVTKEGISKDLEWMKRVGIGGFQAFDISFGSGQLVDKKVSFMTPEWLDAIRHTAAEADRLGLDMTMATSAGWSETGGPWVKPEEAIKKIVWSETRIVGGKKFIGKLPQPPSVNGPIRNLHKKEISLFGGQAPDPTFYADQVVLAYRTPKDESGFAHMKPKVSSSSGSISNASALLDEDLTTKISIPVPTTQNPIWIQYEYAQPFKAQAFSIALGVTSIFGSSSMRPGYVEASEDGKTFRTLFSLPGAQHDIRALPVRTFSFPQTSARYYRLVFTKGSGISTVGDPDDFGGFGGPTKPPTHFDITEAVFYSGGRVNRWEDKAHFAPMFEFETLATPAMPESTTIRANDIIDLTSKMGKDGTLNWEVPAGNWTILRLGYSLTGAKNGPALPAGTGFEVDKLNSRHLESYYNGYVHPISKAMGPLFGKSMKYFLADSYEADAQNWTEDMIPEFTRRRGYNPTPYLPVLAGRIVTSAEVSDRFLWDFRRTIADLLAENHYGKLADLTHKQGIKLYSEAAGISLPVIQDALMNKGRVDIPMGEFRFEQPWITPKDLESNYAYRGAIDRLNAHQADVREAASAAHIYGKKIVGAESWTFGGYEAPASLKPIGDYWNTQGINQFIFHTSVHQPLDTKPGNIMVGTHINRNITWAELAKPFITYLSRNQYLLQQGNFVGDIAYFLGEDIPSAVPYWKKISPEPPEGYDYDFINTEILLDSLSVKDGSLILFNGMTYRILVLPETFYMTPYVLKKIRTLVANGATIVGPKPVKSPGLAGYPAVDSEVALLANEIWGDADGKMVLQNDYGKGKVYWGVPIKSVLAEKKVPKDFDYTRPNNNTYLTWIHRRISDADIYFVSNQREQSEDLKVTLRVSGKVPELWHSDKGTVEPASYNIDDSITTVKLHLDPFQSVFIVLRKKALTQKWFAPQIESKLLHTFAGSWEVSFPPNLGAPAKIILDTLESWTNHANDGVKYFGGSATYLKMIQADQLWFIAGRRLMLDLGNVKDVAEVALNGKVLDTLWKAPYRIDVTEVIRSGVNSLEIKVTNQWTNRISGDRNLPTDKKVLSPGGGFNFGGQNRDIKESGLIGPVTISSESMNK